MKKLFSKKSRLKPILSGVMTALVCVAVCSCKFQKSIDSASIQKFDFIVTSSIDSMSRDSYFGIMRLEAIFPARDTTVSAKSIKIKCLYKRFYATIDFNNVKTSMAIDAIGCNKRSDAQFLYDYDDDLSDQKIQERNHRVLVNDMLYKITLEQAFDQTDVYLLNCNIKLLQCYITLNDCKAQ